MPGGRPEVSIVVPVYNSALIIPELVSRIENAMQAAGLSYELILTDDVSPDHSWQVISDLASTKKYIKGLRLAKNCGQWGTTLAGLSRAQGRYIVTIDDDLEYEPADIPAVYQAITGGDYSVVFGMSDEKYILQGKSRKLSNWRRSLVYRSWGSPVTESFRIFKREVVFDGEQFLPAVYIDAYLVNAVARKNIGYTRIRFNKRFAGTSNISFWGKARLFLLFSFHFSLYRVGYMPLMALLFLLCATLTAAVYAAHIISHRSLILLGSFLFISGFMGLYYFRSWFRRTQLSPPYQIIAEIN